MQCKMKLFSLITIVGWVYGSSKEKHESILQQLPISRKMVKRQAKCPVGEYYMGSHCCTLCPAGKSKSLDCTQAHNMSLCTSCKEGEYMDEPNQDHECHRCASCDHGEGLEVHQRCTPKQDTICQCMELFFCNIPSPCKHCEACDKCENQLVVEECTRHTNTVCKEKDSLWILWILVPIVFACVAAAAAAACCFIKRKNACKHVPPPDTTCCEELIPLTTDVDLQPYFTDIAEILTLDEMKTFARKTGIKEAIIDQIKNDCVGSTSEHKIQLLNEWYKSRRMQGEFSELINTLTQINKKAADELHRKISSSSTYKNDVRCDAKEDENSDECNA